MDKREAEQLLGLDGAYDYKDMNKAYREQVKKNHPDMGGSPEVMVQVNKAKEFMEKQFLNNRNAIFSTDDPYRPSYTSTSYKRGTYTPPKASTNPSWQPSKSAGERDAEARKRQEDKKKRAEAAKAAHDRNKQSSSSSSSSGELWSDYVYGKSEPKKEVPWFVTAYGESEEISETVNEFDAMSVGKKFNEKTVEGLPIWYTIVNGIVNHFPWRIGLWLLSIFAFYFLSVATDDPTGAKTLLTVVFFLIASANLLFGTITNPIRKGIVNIMNSIVRSSRAKNPQPSPQPRDDAEDSQGNE